jgi:curved DNA-binding protein CbpA
MVLYNLLELHDWNAGTEQIQAAYRKAAMKYHPDRVDADRRQEANAQMQRVNAAKEVLLDARRRRAYNRSGKLPWDT